MGTKNNSSRKPRLVGGIVTEMLQGWHRNTDLAVDLKTILRSDRTMKTGKDYQGILRRDSDAEIEDFFDKRSGKADYRCRDAHYTFVEALPWTSKRNPRVFRGKYITVTRRDNSTLRLNFRSVRMDRGFNVVRFALGVGSELMQALEGLVEER